MAGGLAVFWNDRVSLVVDHHSSAFFDLICTDLEFGLTMRLTCLHAPAVYHLRQSLWAELKQISQGSTLPWLCVGDFNDILYPWEKVGKRPAAPHRMYSFQEFLNDCSLMDLGSKGCTFTWNNNRSGEDLVKERLDRMLCSREWRLTFPAAEVFALPALGSDHSPLLLTTEAIRSHKLKAVSIALTKWSKSKFVNARHQINYHKQHLQLLNNQPNSHYDQVLVKS